jgi:hypothetical protein
MFNKGNVIALSIDTEYGFMGKIFNKKIKQAIKFIIEHHT